MGVLPIVLMILSMVCIVAYLIYAVSIIFNKDKRYKNRTLGGLIFASVAVVISIFLLRLAVNISGAGLEVGEEKLPFMQEIFNSLLQTFRSFGVDEEYKDFITDYDTFLLNISLIPEFFRNLLIAVASLVDIAAPLLGCAVIFEILANVFPKMWLWFISKFSFRHIHYFSELNEASLSLAESLCTDSKIGKARPRIVFTDAYKDKTDEKSSELFGKAKNLGAICVRDDISHVIKPLGRKKKCYYYFIDKKEENNLQSLLSFSEGHNYKYIKCKNLYLFVESDMYLLVEGQFLDKLEKKYNFSKDELPTIVPVRIYRNLVSNLLVKIPLYEPIACKLAQVKQEAKLKKTEPEKVDLNVTIFGSGFIGTEMFLSTYWIGQMLDVNLKINIVSYETEDDFWNRINYINPEIKKTVKYKEAQEKDPILKCNENEYAPYYANVCYHKADIKTGVFCSKDSELASVMEADYFMVALGSDKDNVTVAEKLREYVGESHLKQFVENGKCNKTVISYVVYDSELCETLNRTKEQFNVNYDPKAQLKEPDVYMYAFGSLKDTYKGENVFMSSHSIYAKLADSAYKAGNQKKSSDIENRARAQGGGSDYDYWANLAKTMHHTYKVASLGWIDTSVFDAVDLNKEDNKDKNNNSNKKKNKETVEADSPHEKQVKDASLAYRLYSVAKNTDTVFDEIKERYKDSYDYETFDSYRNRIAWLEHRRWSAFTRVMGFRATAEYAGYNLVTGKHKHMSLKLHPCLVECDENGERINIFEFFNVSFENDKISSVCGCTKKLDTRIKDKEKVCESCIMKDKCIGFGGKNNCSTCEKCENCKECETCDKRETCQKRIDRENKIIRNRCISCQKNTSCEYVFSKRKQEYAVPSCLESELDMLDKVSIDLGNKKGIKYSNFKEYDYYELEFGEYLTIEKAAEKYGLDDRTIIDKCVNGEYAAVLSYGEGKYLLSDAELKEEKDEADKKKKNNKDKSAKVEKKAKKKANAENCSDEECPLDIQKRNEKELKESKENSEAEKESSEKKRKKISFNCEKRKG